MIEQSETSTPSAVNRRRDDARWQAVLTRDRGAAGAFFYAVRTTGVVCRPGCSSRAPRRENVVFYRDLASALRAGFRTCRRCKPGAEATGVPAFLLPACRALEQEPAITLAALANLVGVSSTTLRRGFTTALGLTPRDYADALRAGRFRDALGDSESVLDASYAAGFGAPSRMYEQAPALLGMAPSDYRNGAPGQRISLATARCSLGAVAVAATDQGVCAVELGDSPEEVEAVLRDRFARAQLCDASVVAAQWLAQTVRVIDEQASPQEIPLDIRGTVFQQQVWRALREVPSGATLSYAQLAARIGRPSAARAVARACASNSLAVLVPCHRVVRGDGSLSGYRWGVGRKRALLEVERDE